MSEQERRKFNRFPFNGIVSFAYKSEIFNGILIDISLKGALVQMADGCSISKKTLGGIKPVKFNFSLNNNAIKILFTGSIVHIEGNKIGIRCEHIGIDSASHLKRLVELNLGESLLLARELSALISPDDFS